jgi:hypothetical protein
MKKSEWLHELAKQVETAEALREGFTDDHHPTVADQYTVNCLAKRYGRQSVAAQMALIEGAWEIYVETTPEPAPQPA